MSSAALSIVALVAAVGVGVWRRANIGVIAMFFAFALGRWIFDIDGREIARDWPIDVFFIMMTVMLLFGFANTNGTTHLMATKLAYASRRYAKLLPWVFMLATAALTVCGADPSVVVFMLPIGLAAGEVVGLNPIILCTMVEAGAIIGGCGPFSIIGVVTGTLAGKAGVTNYLPIWLATSTTLFLESVIIYVVLGGFRSKAHASIDVEKPGCFNINQKITMAIIALTLCLILFARVYVGAAMAIGSALMMLFRVADEKAAIKSVNWGVLVMVGGTGVLVSVMGHVGGVQLLAKLLSSVMTPHTAAPLIGSVAGLMTLVSSWTGVVAPALFPTLPGIADQLHGAVRPEQLMQAVQSIGLSLTYSPLSATGAMGIASLPATADYRKMFNAMLAVAVLSMIFAMLMNYIGVYSIYIDLFN